MTNTDSPLEKCLAFYWLILSTFRTQCANCEKHNWKNEDKTIYTPKYRFQSELIYEAKRKKTTKHNRLVGLGFQTIQYVNQRVLLSINSLSDTRQQSYYQY